MLLRTNTIRALCLPWLLCVAFAWSSTGCKDDSSPRVGGETHWVSCETESECGDGESCVCERCVSGCTSDSECNQLSADATCELLEDTPLDTNGCSPSLERICMSAGGEDDSIGEPDSDDDSIGEPDGDDDDDDTSSTTDDGSDDDSVRDDVSTDDDADDDDSVGDDDDPDDDDSADDDVNSDDDSVTNDDSATDDDTADPSLPEILGRSLIEAEGCFSLPESVGETGCASGSLDEIVRTTALDEAGTCWLFSTSCIPPGFTAAPAGSECSPDLGACGNGCEADTFSVGDDCLSCNELRASEVDARGELLDLFGAASCSSDADCVVASTSTSCAPACNTVIGESARSQFEAELAALDQTFCGAANSTQCTRVQTQCQQPIATCVEGQCSNRPQQPSGMCEMVLSDGECVDCTDALTRHAAALDVLDARSDLKQCEVDDDCTLVTPATECATLCPLIIGTDSVSAAEQAIEQLSDDYCEGYANADCPQVIADCALQVPVCEQGLCAVAGQTQACAARTPESCELDGNCMVARAHGYHRGQECFASGFLDVACRDDPGGCGDAETPALDEHGECWLLPDTCLPPGFTAADGTSCQSEGGFCDEDLCDVRSVDECLDDADCGHFNAYPLNDAERCYEVEMEPVACVNAAFGCTGDLRLAVDLNDACWVLPAGCMPFGMRDPRDGECPDVDAFCE